MSYRQARQSYVYIISLVAAIGGFLFGYDLSVISGAIIFMKEQFAFNSIQVGFAMSSAVIGCIAGPVVGGWLANRIGRKKTLFLAVILFGISAIGSALPRNFFEFNTFRIIGGLGVGMSSVVSPMYIAEISPARIRGRLVSFNQLAIVIGSTMSIIVSYFIAKYVSELISWRWMFASECVPIIFFLIALCFIPRSPRWLVQKDYNKEALKVLTKINGKEQAEHEIKGIHESLTIETGGISELFQSRNRVALIIAVGLAFFQQMGGVSTLLFYAPIIFQKAGFIKAQDAIAQTIILNLWNISCTVLAIWLVDRLGRRPLLITGTLGMAIGMTLMGILFHFDISGIFVVIVMFICVGFYVTSLAPLAWLIMSEIFPTRIRGAGMGVAGVTLWITVFFVNQFFPPIREYFENTMGSGAGVFWIFAVMCICAFIFGLRLVPETKGKTLEEITFTV